MDSTFHYYGWSVWGQVSFIVCGSLRMGPHPLGISVGLVARCLVMSGGDRSVQVALRCEKPGFCLFSATFYLDHESYLDSPSLTLLIHKKLPEL